MVDRRQLAMVIDRLSGMDYSLCIVCNMEYKDLIIQSVFWFLGFLLLFRIRSHEKNSGERKSQFVSIIIPARNEEKSLPVLLDSLQENIYPTDEIIVVVSPSEDRTLEVARRDNVKVIQLASTPQGWVGKPWACYQGALTAKGDILVFLDADTWLEKDGLKKILDTHITKDGVISVQPYHAMKKSYEQLSAFFNIIMMGAMGTFTVMGDRIKPLGLFGPCIVIKKEDYLKAGGHEVVKGEVVEDLAIGNRLKKCSIPIYCYRGKGAISFRMYPNGIKELIDGWSKGFATGAIKTYIPILILIIAWIGGAISSTVNVFEAILSMNASTILVWSLAYTGYVIQIYWMLFRLGTFKFYTALFYPIFLLFFLCIFMYSIFNIFIRRTVRWKGTAISLKNK
ncbi:MAG: glycosyltransferase [Dehalococcoidales bacterium]|nr:glycosyltransferase [Dehalococcoidales bacterium]